MDYLIAICTVIGGSLHLLGAASSIQMWKEEVYPEKMFGTLSLSTMIFVGILTVIGGMMLWAK